MAKTTEKTTEKKTKAYKIVGPKKFHIGGLSVDLSKCTDEQLLMWAKHPRVQNIVMK